MASSPLMFIVAVTVVLSVQAASSTQNLTEVLLKNGNFPLFIKTLDELDIGRQIQNQLNHSNDEFTVFAPTDNAFNKLPPGTWNNLNAQQKAAFINYHILPKYHNFTTIPMATNPIRTRGNYNGVDYTFNITANSNPLTQQFNVSTGVNTVMISYDLNSSYPLEVFVIDSMLLPPDLFPKTVDAPPPSPVAANRTTDPPSISGGSNSAEDTPGVPPSSVEENSGFMVNTGGLVGFLGVLAFGLF